MAFKCSSGVRVNELPGCFLRKKCAFSEASEQFHAQWVSFQAGQIKRLTVQRAPPAHALLHLFPQPPVLRRWEQLS